MRRAIGYFFGALLWIVAILAFAVVIVPRFLDRIYYAGPASGHFDGARFFNPGRDDTHIPPGGGSRFQLFWRNITGDDGRPPWPSHVPVTPAKPAPRVEGERLVVTWVGHATWLIQTQGLNILTDPIWSDTAGPFGVGPRRAAEPGIRFDDLPKIDLVVVSHNHYDHMDVATLGRLAARDNPQIVTSLGNDRVIGGASSRVSALDWGGQVPLTNCPAKAPCVTAPVGRLVVSRNHHWSSRWFADRNRALWSSFTIVLPGGNIFFAGDTGFGDGEWPRETAKLGPVRLALIPIGAFRFVPGEMETASHLGPVQAAEVFDRTGAGQAFSMHWGTFRLSYEARDTPPKMLAEAMRCRAQTGFDSIGIGVPTDVAPYADPLRKPLPASYAECLKGPALTALR